MLETSGHVTIRSAKSKIKAYSFMYLEEAAEIIYV